MLNEGRAVLVVERLSDMTQYVGKKIGTGDWLQIDQQRDTGAGPIEVVVRSTLHVDLRTDF